MHHRFIILFFSIIFLFAPITSQAQGPVDLSSIMPKEESCEIQRNFAQKVIERVGYCNVDADCFNKDFGCPFGCNNAVSHSQRVMLADQAVESYKKSCGTCEYKCAQHTQRPKCYYGRCYFSDPTAD